MNNNYSKFEVSLIQALTPLDAEQAFVQELGTRLIAQHKTNKKNWLGRMHWKPAALAFSSLVLMLLFFSVLVIGPQDVYAQIMKLLGYIPGIGIVEQTPTTRIIEKPVRITREGVTVSVNSLYSSESETRIEVGISGVPLSAYAPDETISGCKQQAYLRLPDGTILAENAIIPADVYEITYVLPCIYNTRPATTPLNWEIPLTLVSIPENVEVFPVTTMSSDSDTEEPTPQAETISMDAIEITEMIEARDQYILIGWFNPEIGENQILQMVQASYRDVEGQPISVETARDIDTSSSDVPQSPNAMRWAIQFDKTVNFPITIQYSANILERVEGYEPAQFSLDVGANPTPGQTWEINQEFAFGPATIEILSITAVNNGYRLQYTSNQAVEFSLMLDGFTAVGGGGGPDSRSLAFESMPSGNLTFRLADVYTFTENRIWHKEWQPAPQNTGIEPKMDPSAICVDRNVIDNLPSLPATWEGWVLASRVEPIPQLTLSDARGETQLFIVVDTFHGKANYDGSQIAYNSSGGIVVADRERGKSIMFGNTDGHDLSWSPDGSMLAFVNTPNAFGIHITQSDGSASAIRQLTDLGLETIAGWSPDGSMLYYAVPDASMQGFMLRAVSTTSGVSHDLFLLEDSSLKDPFPSISPDGMWVAYRDTYNSSVYIKSMDGNTMRLILDKPAAAVSGITWDHNSTLLGVSLIREDSSEISMIVDINTCTAYQLANMEGKLENIFFLHSN